MPPEYSQCPLSCHVKNWVVLSQGSLLSFQRGHVPVGHPECWRLGQCELLFSSGLKTLLRTGLPSQCNGQRERYVTDSFLYG